MHRVIKPCMAVRHGEVEEAQDSCRSASDELKDRFLVNSRSLAVQLVAGLLQVLRVQHFEAHRMFQPKSGFCIHISYSDGDTKKVTSAHIVRE